MTVWHRPKNCDIIPLTKLQKLQENTVPNETKDGFTQTSQSKITSRLFRDLETRDNARSSDRDSHHRHHSASGGQSRSSSGGGIESRSGELLASPQGRYSYRHVI